MSNFAELDRALPDIRAALDGATAIACVAHKDADADSLGSALAMVLALRNAGKEAVAVVPSPLPKGVSYLPGFDDVIVGRHPECDLVMTFDCPVLERFGDQADFVASAPAVIVIDHHASGRPFGTCRVIEASASATGQMVAALLDGLGYLITPDIANNLYAALFTDTGGFRHDNTTQAALALGAELVGRGANAPYIALKSYKSKSVTQVRLTASVVAALESSEDGTLIWSSVTRKRLEDAGATLEDAEGIIDELQSIDTMGIAILFKEAGPSTTKMSVRTRAPYDAVAICSPFGGGGHVRAAGAEFPLPIAEAADKVLKVARDVWASHEHGGTSVATSLPRG